MITRLSLNNFKAFKSLEELEIRDLTIIAGKNSCGKSSILQSLLLLKQTIDDASNSPLCSEGRFLKFSNLKEISFGLPKINRASIGYRLHVDLNTISADIDLSFKNKKTQAGYSVQLGRLIGNIKLSPDSKSSGLTGVGLESLSLKAVEKIINERIGRLKSFRLNNFKIKYNGFLPEIIEVHGTHSDGKEDAFSLPVLFFSDIDWKISAELNNALREIKYLSPVRAIPERAYVHFSNDASQLNHDGSNAAHVLWARQSEEVKWKNKSLPLKNALNECVETIGLNQSISPNKSGDILYRVAIKELATNKQVSLSDVGFGYSQILPIILMGLLQKPKQLILLEQPEIHLHPAAAANLADLFLGFIEDNKRFIIETHSQELINRIRLRVVQNPALAKRINIVFVESGAEQGSTIKQFQIDQNGMFPEWPDGFLDESEKLALAILEARISRK